MSCQCVPSSVRRHCGYVLLVTLVLLSLTALAAAAVSRAALARAQAADEAQADFQRRWGTLTCRAILLPKAETLIHAAEVKLKLPVVSWRGHLALGGQDFELVFSDESAKAHVGTLIARQSQNQAALAVRRLALSNPTLAGKVHLRWAANSSPQSFGEVFESFAPRELLHGDREAAPSDVLTCWGDGRLNIHRVSQDVLQEICGTILNLSQIEQLLALRQAQPNLGLIDALNKLRLNSTSRSQAETALTDTSNCHSLWIICHGQRRSFWNFSVLDESQAIGGEMHSYEW